MCITTILSSPLTDLVQIERSLAYNSLLMYIRCRPLGVDVKSSLEHGWCWILHIRDLVLASQQATGSLCMGNGAAITIPYSGKISKEKSFAKLVKKNTIFVQKTLQIAHLIRQRMLHPKITWRKLFTKP